MKHTNKKEIPRITTSFFKGKQTIQWNDVESYLKKYIGKSFTVEAYNDHIMFNSSSADEYCESRYTKQLRGALAKAKANAALIIPSLIVTAHNRRWTENKNIKHSRDASLGWYRYDVDFAMAVKGSTEANTRWNFYKATMVVRINNRGLYFYDIIDIKKEARTLQGSSE